MLIEQCIEPLFNGRSKSSERARPGNEAYNHIIFRGDLVRIGLFRCRPWHDLFQNDRQAQGHYLVFPRASVYITPEGKQPIVADPNVVIFYNRYQLYRRARLSDQGDASVYFDFSPKALLDALRPYDPAVMERPHQPFTLDHGPSDPQSYLLQRLVVAHLLDETQPDRLFVQETMLQVLDRVLENGLPGTQSNGESDATRRAHAELAHETRSLLTSRFQESLSLAQIAAELYASPFHLSRVFRRQTGYTIHRYRNQLRLRVGLEHVLHSDIDLGELAGSLGYANHSHFTKAFRTLFQSTPSELRRSRSLPEMSKNLTV